MTLHERERDKLIRRAGHCPHSISCFECPLPDCKANDNWVYAVNLTPYDAEHKKKLTR